MKLFTLGFLLFLQTACTSLLYYPSQQTFFDPKKFGIEPENVYFQDKAGRRIHAWWFDSKITPAKGTFVFFHGNAENLTSHFASMSWLPAAGYNYLIFDYPGYGQSEGKPTPEANVISGMAALEWVKAFKDSSPLIVYGQSMGGIVALRSVIETRDSLPVRAVVVDGTFPSFQTIARKKMSLSWVTWLLQPLAYVAFSDQWAPQVEKISPVPLIVFHGAMDPIVEVEHGRALYEKAREPKVYIEIPKGHHGDTFWIEEGKYRKVLMEELAKIKPL